MRDELPWTTDDEVRWLQYLGKTRHEQARAVYAMLVHAADDRMSAWDRAICARAYRQLTGKPWQDTRASELARQYELKKQGMACEPTSM